MKTVFHAANSRGHANLGWLDTYHTFSFSNYHNKDRMSFGVLRVLNDDSVSQGMGFGAHPHRDMEIISFPLEGELEHKDSMGNISVIKKGDIQVMSAGSGVTHSEFNRNKQAEAKFLQIWVFPRTLNVEPRYDQISIDDHQKRNDFLQILSPNQNDEGVWIHQDAWFHLAKFDQGFSKEFRIKKEGNGVYAFLIKGSAVIAGEKLTARDGLGIWETQIFEVEASEDAEILLMEVPMELPDYLL